MILKIEKWIKLLFVCEMIVYLEKKNENLL